MKVLAGMQWSMQNVPDDYFYVTSDDDLIVNMTDIPKRLRLHIKLATQSGETNSNLPRTNVLYRVPILCIFSYREREGPSRDPTSKYFLDVKEFHTDTFPPYCRGGFYMIPVVKVGQLYNISRSHKALPMDDVWITGILRNQLPINLRSIDPIDEGSVDQFSDHIAHLRGDIEGGPTVQPAEALLATWKETYKVLAKKRHCLVNEVKHSR